MKLILYKIINIYISSFKDKNYIINQLMSYVSS